jgi:hypothetical protein
MNRIMKRLVAASILVLATIPATGCGTICNLAGGIKDPENEPRIYGGIQKDLEVANDLALPHLSQGGPSAAIVPVVVLGAAATEGSLSLAGDTLTLPITVYLQEKRIKEQTSNAPASVPNPQVSNDKTSEPSKSSELPSSSR